MRRTSVHEMKRKSPSRDRVPTGVEGLDNMLGGGLPTGTCTLVLGGPGAGKTIFGVQFLCIGAIKYHEPGLYVSLDESPTHLRRNMECFGWNLQRLEQEGHIFILDLSVIRTFPGEIDSRLVKTNVIETIRNKAQEIRPRRIVIDSLATLIVKFPNIVERRNVVIELFQTVMDLRATGLMLNELHTTFRGRKLQVEEFLAQGVIILRTLEERLKLFRALQIEKMRGVSHDSQLRPYTIDTNGLRVFSQESIFVPATSISTKR